MLTVLTVLLRMMKVGKQSASVLCKEIMAEENTTGFKAYAVRHHNKTGSSAALQGYNSLMSRCHSKNRRVTCPGLPEGMTHAGTFSTPLFPMAVHAM